MVWKVIFILFFPLGDAISKKTTYGDHYTWDEYEQIIPNSSGVETATYIKIDCRTSYILEVDTAASNFYVRRISNSSDVETENRFRYEFRNRDLIKTTFLEMITTRSNFENVRRIFIWSDVETENRFRYDVEFWIGMDNRYVDHLQTENGEQTITYLQNAGSKLIWLNIESWIENDNTYRYVVNHPEKARGTHTIIKMQNCGWKFILSNVKSSWSVFRSDNESRYYVLTEEDYQMLMFEFCYKLQSNQILTELNMKCQPSCYYSEETDIYNQVIIFLELKIQRSMESPCGIESTALLATFILAAFAIRIVSEEELMKDTLTLSPIVQITTKEVRQNLPRRAEEEAFRQCGFCINHNQAIAYCNTCKLNICMPCKNTHKKVWTYINHTVCPFDEM